MSASFLQVTAHRKLKYDLIGCKFGCGDWELIFYRIDGDASHYCRNCAREILLRNVKDNRELAARIAQDHARVSEDDGQLRLII